MARSRPVKNLLGYRSRLCTRPGDTIEFMVHSHEGLPYEADLVRIVHGELEPTPGGPGLVLEEHDAPFAGSYPGVVQDLRIGSFLRAELPSQAPADGLCFAVAIQPTRYLERDQTLADLRGDGTPLACLRLDGQGRLNLEVSGCRESLDLPLPLHRWSIVGLSLEPGRATLFQSPLPESVTDGVARHRSERSWYPGALPDLRCRVLTLGSRHTDPPRPEEPWNGRMDSPRLVARALETEAAEALVRAETPPASLPVQAFWDFSRGMDEARAHDVGPLAAHGQLFNLPNRALRGFRATGDVTDWRQAPLHYGAIHFHDDDVYDMAWSAAFSFEVPDGLRSGAYAARLRQGEETEYLTFFVSPGERAARAVPSIAFLIPTATYLAYGNERAFVTGAEILMGFTPPIFPEAHRHEEHRGFGLSPYDAHDDGSGIHYGSWLRPLWNLRPSGRHWGFPADTNLIHWLETRGFDYDVLTDHDLHERGADALADYRVVLTGTHPEYQSTRMLDAMEAFLGRGGRLMYLGGNGYYWRVALSEHWPATVEVRRAEDGTRTWACDPGEYHHAFGGELGGLWRRIGRAPNRLVGTGFTAQGFLQGRPYARTEASRDPRVAFMFEGVQQEVFGRWGRRGGGVVGEEVDRFDTSLGSPEHALVVASQDRFADDMILTKEELLVNVPPDNQPIRADVVFFETPAGGAVFSASSIAWSSALEHEDYANDVARLSENVLRRFADPAPFEMPPVPEPEVPSRRTERAAYSRLKA